MNRIPKENEREDSRWTREGEKDGEEEGEKEASSSSVIGPAGVCLLGGWMETDSIQTCTAGSLEKLLAARSHKPDWHNGKKWLADTLNYHHTHTHTQWKALQSGLGPTMALFIPSGMLLRGTTSIFTSSKQHHQSSAQTHTHTGMSHGVSSEVNSRVHRTDITG